MKHLILPLFFVLFGTASLLGQTQKGSHFVGGQFRLDNLFREGNDLFSIGLSPDYAFFVFNNVALGARADLQYIRSGGDDLFSFIGIPFVRYYIPGQSRTRFYLGAGVGGGIVSIEGDTRGSFRWDVGPGVNFFVNEHVALEAELYYEGISREQSDYISSVGLRMGFQVFLFKSEDE
jgi:opacity protein-like surface antigen